MYGIKGKPQKWDVIIFESTGNVDKAKIPIIAGCLMDTEKRMGAWHLADDALTNVQGMTGLKLLVTDRSAYPVMVGNAEDRQHVLESLKDLNPIAEQAMELQLNNTETDKNNNMIASGIGTAILALVAMLLLVIIVAMTKGCSV